MGKQRNRPQMKEEENSSTEEPDEIGESKLSDREFRVMIISILNSMKEDIKSIKKDQLEINHKKKKHKKGPARMQYLK